MDARTSSNTLMQTVCFDVVVFFNVFKRRKCIVLTRCGLSSRCVELIIYLWQIPRDDMKLKMSLDDKDKGECE